MSDTEKLFKNRKKIKTFEDWLNAEDIYVQINALHEGVVVPEEQASDPMLVLKMSNAFNYIPETSEDGISVTLSFSGNYSECFLPWESVWGMRKESGESLFWKECIPKEAAMIVAKGVFKNIGKKFLGGSQEKGSEEQQREKRGEKEKAGPKKPATKKGSHLKRVK